MKFAEIVDYGLAKHYGMIQLIFMRSKVNLRVNKILLSTARSQNRKSNDKKLKTKTELLRRSGLSQSEVIG